MTAACDVIYVAVVPWKPMRHHDVSINWKYVCQISSQSDGVGSRGVDWLNHRPPPPPPPHSQPPPPL